MPNSITVKGTGCVHVPPDTIEISFTLQAKAEDYSETMQIAEKKRNSLHGAVASAGCKPDDLKTTNFQVNTNYEHLPDESGNYRPVSADISAHIPSGWSFRSIWICSDRCWLQRISPQRNRNSPFRLR